MTLKPLATRRRAITRPIPRDAPTTKIVSILRRYSRKNGPVLPLVLTLRFALELTLLAVVAWWGYSVGGVLVGALCAIGVAVVWGLLLSPKARFPLPTQVRNAVEVAVFLLAAAGLSALGHPALGVVLIAADVLILLTLWRLGATTGGEPV